MEMKYSTRLVWAAILCLTSFGWCDYIRSDLLIVSEDMDPGAELVNLNKLIGSIHRAADRNYLFKLVNDSLLSGYVELKRGQEATWVALKRRVNLAELRCASANSDSVCEKSLKIIAVNQNDFIEIPVKLTKAVHVKDDPKAKSAKIKLSLAFKQERVNFNLTSVKNQIQLEPADVTYKDLAALVKYTIEHESDDYLNVSLSDNLRLRVDFKNKNVFDKAFNLNKMFTLKLTAWFASPDYQVKRNATQTIALKVTPQNNKSQRDELRPLDFESSVYSIIVTDLDGEGSVLEPKLKNRDLINNKNGHPISFTLYDEENSELIENSRFPFEINQSTGAIGLKQNRQKHTLDKFYSFGIKATYNQLDQSKEKLYNYDYMLSAFAKIQIKVEPSVSQNANVENENAVTIKSEIITSFITKYEIINEYSTNQTYIMYINDPIGLNTRLIKLFHDQKSGDQFGWTLSDENTFKYELRQDLVVSNKVEFKDQNVYKTVIKLEKSKQVVCEIKLEFHIDFDPLLFEKNEYNLYLSQADLLHQDLAKFSIKERLNFNSTVVYRLTSASTSNNNDEEFFEINSSTGVLQARKLLTQKPTYELNVIGMSAELQKTAMARLKIQVDCFKRDQENMSQRRRVKFSLFEHSPNRTQVGILKSVCSNSNYKYELDKEKNDHVVLRICSNRNNCSMFGLNLAKLNNFNPQENKLFDLETRSGLLMTNYLISSSLLFSLVRPSEQIDFFEAINIYEKYDLSVLLNSTLTNFDSKLNYDIEIRMHDSPKIVNFDDILAFDAIEQAHIGSESVQSPSCLYSYKFASTNNNNIQRFVKLDANSAHLEAEFKTQDCYASFFIHNNGCLKLKYDDLNKTSQCMLSTVDAQNRVLIKSGLYALEFKLCYYDNNKVSCSQMYQQNIQIRNDLRQNCRLKLWMDANDPLEKEKTSVVHFSTTSTAETATELSEQKQSLLSSLLNPNLHSRHQMINTSTSTSTKTNMIFFNDTNKSYYLLVLVVIILIVALLVILAFTFLFIIYARPSSSSRKKSDEKSKKSADVLVVTTSPSSSNKSSILNTPETASSNAASSSSNEESKIQVSDDYKQQQQQQQPQTQQNENANYASSFTSLSSGSNNNEHEKPIMSMIERNPFESGSSSYFGASANDQGLYSVKTASIKFQNRASNSLLMKTYDNVINNLIMDSNSSSSSMSHYNANSLRMLNNNYLINNSNPILDENNLYKKYETNHMSKQAAKVHHDVIASVV